MPYDPPKGAELLAVKRLKRIVERLERLSFDVPSTMDISINAGHALDGAREGGAEGRLVNGMRVLRDIHTFVQGVTRARRSAVRAEIVALQQLALAEVAMECFKACPSCKGACGRFKPPEQKFDINWRSCTRCKGRGLVPQET